MKTVGQMVEETISMADRGLPQFAFLHACEALNQTAQNAYLGTELVQPAYQKFIDDHWRLIYFMAIGNSQFPENLPFNVRRTAASLQMPHLAKEIISHTVRHTLSTRQMPLDIGFTNFGNIRVENDKLLFTPSFLTAIVGSAILHPVNKNEEVHPRHWISIWDFKMFISELWGRMDLAERIMDLHQ